MHRLTTIFERKPKQSSAPLFDEAFLRRLERLSFRTVPSLRGAMMGERRSRNLRPALDFSDHRPYTAGDDLRHVDWNAYARHEELFVKLGEATQSVSVHILIDRSRSMSWSASTHPGASLSRRAGGGPMNNKWDGARRLAGALSYLGLAGGERVTVTPFAHGLSESFGPTQGKRQVVRALQFLAAIESEPPFAGEAGGNDLARSLLTYARSHPGGGLLVLISDLLDTAAALPQVRTEATQPVEDQLAEGLRHFAAARWQVLVIHLLTEQEVHPTFEGDFDLRDVETGETLPFSFDERTLAQYRLRVRQWCAGLQSICAGRGATYSRILVEWPLEQAVIPYLRQRRAIQ